MKIVYVDIPTYEEISINGIASYKNIAKFEGPGAEEKALEFCRQLYGADKEGKIYLLTIEEVEEEIKEEE